MLNTDGVMLMCKIHEYVKFIHHLLADRKYILSQALGANEQKYA